MRSIYQGKAEDALPQFPDACFDALICDPPSSIHFMGREWDSNRGGRTQWVAWLSGILKEALRTLKPGGHALIWALPRTSHWTMCAIEDSGFDLRETVHHIYASGMPKGQNIGKAIDKLHKTTRPIVGAGKGRTGALAQPHGGSTFSDDGYQWPGKYDITAPATPEAAQWEGWNTTLKPACELWVKARKPLTVVGGDAILDETTRLLEVLLWLLSPAKLVEQISLSSNHATSEGESVSVRWIADVLTLLRSQDPSEMMAMFSSQEEARTYLNIGWLWSSILDALYANTNTYTTSTRTSLITELKTLNFLISQSIPESIIQDVFPQDGLRPYAPTVNKPSSERSVRYSHIPRPSAVDAVSPIIMTVVVSTFVRIAASLSLPTPPNIESFAPDSVQTSLTMNSQVEYWILARKPLAESTIARQVLATGTGALNIDACRVEGASWGERPPRTPNALYGNGHGTDLTASNADSGGRWPANLVLSHSEGCIPLNRTTSSEDRRKVSSGKGFCTTKYSGSVGEGEGTIIAGVRDYGDGKDAPAWQCTPECPIALLNAQSGISTNGTNAFRRKTGKDLNRSAYGTETRPVGSACITYGDTGGANRYFTTLPYEAPFIYLPKASPKDRTMNGMVENGHETVKSTALMAWLCKLITPPNGTILDCFMGSGSTLVAASRLGFSWVGIDESPEYCTIARARLATLGVEVEVNAQSEPLPVVATPVQPRIRYHVGSIFEVDAQVLVNPVNCQGIMGKGLARQFKERYPEMVAAYREDCRTRKLAIGRPRLYKGSTPWILNLPTKDAWTAPSRLSYIEESLQYIATYHQQAGVTSLAFPKLGCGEGGLSWDDVGPLMVKHLSATSLDVTICVSENDTQYQ